MSMKKIISLIALVLLFPLMTAFSSKDVDSNNQALLKQQNAFWKSKRQKISAKIIAKTRGAKPSEILFLITSVNGRSQVKIILGKNLPLNSTESNQLLQGNADLLTSSNKSTFNRGINHLFKNTFLKVDQRLNLKSPYDAKTDDSKQHKLNLGWALILGCCMMGFLTFIGKLFRVKV